MELTARQGELADAALALLASEGMAAVTFRSVAAASGWSLGAVQKAFASKEELVAAMFTRLRTSAAPGPTQPPGQPDVTTWLTELLVSILPTDEASRALTLQGTAFGERAAYDPAMATVLAGSDAELRGLVATLIRQGRASGELVNRVDPEDAAWAYLALAQGAATQLLYDPVPVDEVRRRARTAVAALLA